MLELQLLVLIGVANAAPIIARRVLGKRFATPLDGGVRFIDGRPLLGPAKTLRGVIASVGTTGVAAPLIGFSVGFGALMAALAMVGDSLSSFIKRRARLPSSARAPGLDQIPECLLPLLVAQPRLGLTWPDVLAVVAAFVVLQFLVSTVLFRLRIRREPY